jgi:hypothetical protein
MDKLHRIELSLDHNLINDGVQEVLPYKTISLSIPPPLIISRIPFCTRFTIYVKLSYSEAGWSLKEHAPPALLPHSKHMTGGSTVDRHFYFVQAVTILPFASVRFLEESTKQATSANSSSSTAHLLPL